MSVLAPEVGNTTALVIASSAGIFRGPTPHWCIPVWKERDVFLQWAKRRYDLLSIPVTSSLQH